MKKNYTMKELKRMSTKRLEVLWWAKRLNERSVNNIVRVIHRRLNICDRMR